LCYKQSINIDYPVKLAGNPAKIISKEDFEWK